MVLRKGAFWDAPEELREISVEKPARARKKQPNQALRCDEPLGVVRSSSTSAALHLGGIVARQLNRVLGPHGHASHFGRQASSFRAFFTASSSQTGQHLHCTVFIGDDVVCRFQRHFHDFVFARAKVQRSAGHR